MKKLFLVIVAFLMFTSVGQAAEKPVETEIQGRSIVIDEKLTITKYDDGRVAPVANSSKLSLNQINQVLSEMNVPIEKIETLSIETKKSIISNGGVAVELQNTNMQQYYYSLDGNQYLVTDENKDEISKIQKQDQITLYGDNNNEISPLIDLGSDSEGIWSGSSLVLHAGKSGSEYVYHLYSEYNWRSSPFYYYSDVIAQSWESSKVVSKKSNGANNWKNMISGNIVQDAMTIDRGFGITNGEFNLKNSSRNYGALYDELRIPDRHKDETIMIRSSYAHPHKPAFVRAVLEIFGITWSDSLNGDAWFWDGTFTVGEI